MKAPRLEYWVDYLAQARHLLWCFSLFLLQGQVEILKFFYRSLFMCIRLFYRSFVI